MTVETAPVESAAAETAPVALTFERTVPRGLVHRHALSEVFLTDSVRLDEDHFVAAAQLPPSHAYYTDHLTAGRPDPLLLLECCRQAETHAVHAHFGAPLGTKFVLREWSMTVADAARTPVATGPVPVTVEATTQNPQWVAGTLRGLGYRMRVSSSGQPLCDVAMRVQYVSDGVYAKLRGRAAGTAPTSESYRGARSTGLVAPGSVGRARPENVVLLDPVRGGDAVTSRLRVAGGHPSLFDHPQDHVPGMVLMEAGRQAALLSAGTFTGEGARRWGVAGLRASFGAYAELDAPLTVRAHRPEPQEGEGRRHVRIDFEQDGRAVAQAAFVLERAEAGAPE
ncbi:ScbA/BarX family gamma-butyrolactone biosynthesis protein [Streptomyces sp. NPDC048664]|uniref:ScbA/BarX family gamma-butyrolactone biosynthesis protein n=1 Tax=Streptomyces sp. NPDC048664 TaxID=3154505 RepID=UPI00342A8A38